MKSRILSIIALLCLAVTSAWAQATYTITLQGDKTDEVKNVTLPWTSKPSYLGQVYTGYQDISVESIDGGDEKVIIDGDNFKVTGYFEGIAKVYAQYKVGAVTDKKVINVSIKSNSPLPTSYTLSKGESAHGTLKFMVDKKEVTTAAEGDLVSVVVKAGKGYKSKDVTARAYTSWEQARAPRRNAKAAILDWVQVTKSAEVDTVFTFTMPAANVEVNATYDHRALTNDMIMKIADQTWTNIAVEPKLTVVDRDYTLIEGTDYTVAYENNVAFGVQTATAKITAKSDIDNYYLGTASATFSIRKKLNETGIMAYAVSDEQHPLVYTGKPLEPEIVVRDVRDVLVLGEDYTVEYSDNVNATAPAKFKLTGIGKYQGNYDGMFFINARDLSEDMISPIIGVVFNGNPQYPKIKITFNGKELVEGDDDNIDNADYFTTFENNTDKGEATVKIDGVNNFSGTVNYKFYIGAKQLTEDMIADITALTYDGNAKEPAPVVTYGDITLNAGTDYTVSYADNTDAGTATLTITAGTNPNYAGTASKKFTIQKANVTVTNPTVKLGMVYNAEALTLLNAGTVEGGEMQYSLDNETWSATVSTATDAGEYTVYYKVVGDKNHNDIDAKSLIATIAKADLTTMTLAETTFTYNKEEQTAAVATVSAGTIPVAAENYTVSGNAQTNVGLYTATVTAKAEAKNFKGSAQAQWSIVPADAKIFTMTIDPESFVYNGQAQTPAVTVKDGDAVLTVDKDYTLAFENNINAGTAKVTATGKGNYKNTQEATYTIQKANSAVTKAPAPNNLTYNYKAQELVAAGTCTGGKILYSLDGENFSEEIPAVENAGAYTVYYKVEGDANHNDTKVAEVAAAVKKAQATMAFEEKSYDLTYGDKNFTNEITQWGDNDIRFVSSDPRVAEVHYYTGEVTIKGVGQCTVTAMMQDHKNFIKAADITYTVSVAAKAITEENVNVGEVGENGIPVIDVEVDCPVGTLVPMEGVDYQLSYYDPERNGVSVADMIAAPGEYVAVLTFFGNYEGYVEKEFTLNGPTGPIPGDVTGSGVVEIDDVDDFIDDILSGDIPTDPTSDDFIRFDGNQDGRIDIADAQAILNLSMGLNADGTVKSVRAYVDTALPTVAELSIKAEDMGDMTCYAVRLSGVSNITGFQMDVTNGTVVAEKLDNSSMTMRSNTMPNGKHRIIGLNGYDTENGILLYVYVKGNNAAFENIVLTDAQARSISVNMNDDATGINETANAKAEEGDWYDLNGRKVNGTAKKGVFIQNGKKIVVK